MHTGRRSTVLAVAPAVALLLAGCDRSRPHATPRTPSSAAATTYSPSSGSDRAASPPATRKPAQAQLIKQRIAGASGFRARPAYLYLPPAVRTDRSAHLPVLELLHGVPGKPSDWATHGELVATADGFAAAHQGAAPIIVMPDINGSTHADSECIRTRSGQDVEGYLTGDVVHYVRTRYAALAGRSRWWVAGLSEGGICAAMLALRHPGLYAGFGDFSGLPLPTVGHVTRQESDRQLYGSDPVASLQHQPVWLMRHRRYRHLRAWFACGAQDAEVRAAQQTLVAAARAAHLPTRSVVWAGRHSWLVWRRSLRALLPSVWSAR